VVEVHEHAPGLEQLVDLGEQRPLAPRRQMVDRETRDGGVVAPARKRLAPGRIAEIAAEHMPVLSA